MVSPLVAARTATLLHKAAFRRRSALQVRVQKGEYVCFPSTQTTVEVVSGKRADERHGGCAFHGAHISRESRPDESPMAFFLL
jgi:hypothetical protein